MYRHTLYALIVLGLAGESVADNPAEFNEPQLIYAQAHAGQVDTDGLLSEGEVANPRIDYFQAQRDARRRGDARFENPYNDRAASADRGGSRAEREDRRDRRRYDDRYDGYDRYDRNDRNDRNDRDDYYNRRR